MTSRDLSPQAAEAERWAQASRGAGFTTVLVMLVIFAAALLGVGALWVEAPGEMLMRLAASLAIAATAAIALNIAQRTGRPCPPRD